MPAVEYSGEEELDIKLVLTQFWLAALKDSLLDGGDRMKASELLAKYILGDGSGRAQKQRVPIRPSTASVLGRAQQIEQRMRDGE